MTEQYRLLARKADGRLVFDDPIHYAGVLAALPERISVLLERVRIIRSLKANAYYWACVVPVVADIFNVPRYRDGLLPFSNDQVHMALKVSFLGVEETPLGPVPKSTRGLTEQEFSEYVAKIQAHFTAETGVVFPEPGEAA